MDIAHYNREAWDKQVEKGNRWTVPVTSDEIAAARAGNWDVVLTPLTPVRKTWFPDMKGCDVLGLACGGGQQVPIMAAAGANVTVIDNSSRQLEQDQIVAARDRLVIRSELGDMRDLSRFGDESFDLIFNPCSTLFVPQVQRVFEEAARVLRPGGRLMCGFTNPFRFIFDEMLMEKGQFLVRHTLPYSDDTHLRPEELAKLKSDGEPFMFSHSLEQLIAGQIKAGLQLVDLLEDKAEDALSAYCPAYFATLAQKPKKHD